MRINRACAAERLVDRQARIYSLRPTVHSPSKVIYPGESLMFEKMGHLQTTTTMVTDHHDVGDFVEFISTCRNGAHWHVLGRFNAAYVPFPGFADIQKNWPTACRIIEPSFQLVRRNICHGG
jgi:hypothetical protein